MAQAGEGIGERSVGTRGMEWRVGGEQWQAQVLCEVLEPAVQAEKEC